MIIASLDLGYGIDETEIDDIIFMKAYDELGLDPEKEYSIFHQKSSSDANSGIYNIFIVEPEVLESTVESCIKKTTYIDLIVPAPLLYKSLYSTNTLTPVEAHCFIYFTMDDAFVTIYNDGEFVYSKSLEFSLQQIYERYCAIVGDRVDEKEFFNTLEAEGLKATDSNISRTL